MRGIKARAHARIEEFRGCGHAGAKITLAIASAVASAVALRWMLGVAAVLLPDETWAAEMAQRAVSLAAVDFSLACAIAALGGAASLFHELRTDLAAKFSFVNAFGHMTLAQFAGLLAYLIAVNYGWSVPIALVGCGVSGWGGNKTIVAINDAFVRRLGIVEERKP